MVMVPFEGDAGDDENMERIRRMMGPAQIDQLVRQAIQMCWMSMPREQQSVNEVEKQVRRIVDRALRDLREDGEAFGVK